MTPLDNDARSENLYPVDPTGPLVMGRIDDDALDRMIAMTRASTE